MSDNKLTILGLAAMVMVAAAIGTGKLVAPKPYVPHSQTYLLQGLDIGSIAAVEITSGEEKTTLKRQSGGLPTENDGFVVVEKEGYPADIARFNELIGQCLDIKTAEHCTNNPDNHAALGVSDDTAEYIIRFTDADDKVTTGLYISKTDEQRDGCYVRLLSSDDVYLTLDSLWFNAEPMSYIDRNLISISSADIKSVTVGSSGQSYTLEADEQGKPTLKDIPEGKKLKESPANRLFKALSSLRFEDVAGADSKNLNFEDSFICMLKDSTVYTLRTARDGEQTFAVCSAEFADRTPVLKESGVETEEGLKAKEAKLLARDKTVQFTAGHAGWVYKLSTFQAEDITKKLSDLLEDIPARQKPSTQEAEINSQDAQ